MSKRINTGKGLWLHLLCALALSFTVACSDDEAPADGGAGTGGDGGAGTGGSGGDGGSGGGIPADVSPECATCLNECDLEAATACDQECWDLTACVAQKCPDEADPTACAFLNCGSLIGAAGPAQALAECTETCGVECADDLGLIGGGDDGGMDDAGL